MRVLKIPTVVILFMALLPGLGRGQDAPVCSADSAVGYLMDLRGDVRLLRNDVPSVPKALCIPLIPGDLITMPASGSATILLPNRAYVIQTPGSYRIVETEVLQVSSQGDTTVPPVLGSRGNNLLTPGADLLILPPKMLFAAVKPPLMRAVTKTAVLSPRGWIVGTTPDLVWTGDKNDTFSVQVLPCSNNPTAFASLPVQVTGCELRWSDTGWATLPRGATFRVLIRRSEVELTDETATFSTVEASQAARVEQSIADIEAALPPGVGRDLTKANLLAYHEPSFFAEARLILVNLLKRDPNNAVYLKLMQHCYAGMGIAEGVEAVERRLSGDGAAPGGQ